MTDKSAVDWAGPAKMARYSHYHFRSDYFQVTRAHVPLSPAVVANIDLKKDKSYRGSAHNAVLL